MKKGICIFFLLLILATGNAGAVVQVADGWRMPNDSDMTYDWAAFRGRKESPYLARADFNGDGIPDDVYIALSRKGRKWALFVNLNSKVGKAHIIKLDEDDGNTPPQIMGVSVVKSGKYKTACGKGYGVCERGEPSELNLKINAINYYQFESSNSFFWWDKHLGKFIRTWISD